MLAIRFLETPMHISLTRAPRAVLALGLLIAACRYQPTPVTLQGATSDVAVLAGSWEGEYFGAESRRTGTIMFSVQAAMDSAYGDVVMEPAPGQRITAADVGSGAHAAHSRTPHLLRITFVHVQGGIVQGDLEPYIAPDCECVVRTTFRGAVQGDVVKGEYVTTSQSGLHQTGSWSVRRKRSP
jgi:hypothetical protein